MEGVGATVNTYDTRTDSLERVSLVLEKGLEKESAPARIPGALKSPGKTIEQACDLE
jgi:hypothetical protein